jgi:hypothetical protein
MQNHFAVFLGFFFGGGGKLSVATLVQCMVLDSWGQPLNAIIKNFVFQTVGQRIDEAL